MDGSRQRRNTQSRTYAAGMTISRSIMVRLRMRSTYHSDCNRSRKLTAMADIDDVAVLGDVVLALDQQLTLLFEFHFGMMAQGGRAGA